MISGRLTESALRAEIWPRFSKVLARSGVYLANHSLGRPLDQVAQDVAEFTHLWYTKMDTAWEAFQAEMDLFAANIETLIGAQTGTIVHRASAGQGLRAVLNSFPTGKKLRIVTTAGEFDSLDFILNTYVEAGRCAVDWVAPEEGEGVPLIRAEAVLEKVSPETDLVVVSHVFFGTGQVYPDLNEFVAKCHEKGALVLVDLYHSAGAIPLNVAEIAPDFAVGGSYKYLRGGPGASWLYVSPNVLKSGRTTLDTGWFAKSTAFEFGRGEAAARQPGIGGWAESTPPVIATYQAKSGLALALELGIDRIREYSLERQILMREIFRRAGAPVFEPTHPQNFGAFSLVPSDNAKELVNKLAAAGVTVDARGRMIRLCPDILNSAEEFEVAAKAIASVI